MTSELDTDPLIDKPDSIDQIRSIVPAKKCRWIWNHDWSNWEDTETGTISRGETRIGKYIYQERRCIHCNKVELKTIRT